MVVTVEFIEGNFPLHYLVWQNRAQDLESFIKNSPIAVDLEVVDPRGRTPLFLAVSLSHYESAAVLLQNSAETRFEHSSGWTVVHEAVCSGDPQLLGIVLMYRDLQRRAKRTDLIPKLLRQLKDAPDFYVEMKWEFTSWVPLVTRMCPTNSHRVYKMGSFLRVDSSDVGFDDQSWQKGAISVIFQGRDDCVKIMEVDHATAQVFSSVLHTSGDGSLSDRLASVPDISAYQSTISQRLSHPAIISFINLEKIAFERNKTGIWGWGSDKCEKINNYDCKVFAATNVELVTRMRYEHLAEDDKSRNRSSQKMSQLQKILNTFGSEEPDHSSNPSDAPPPTSSSVVSEHVKVSMEEYFDANLDLRGADIGRPKEMRTKLNKFKATVWLSEQYPLNLQEQLMPIVDIMALSRSQFSKLKDFIQMQIPAGFPLKIEIPLFHLVNACITFHNIFATDEQVAGVSHIVEEGGRLTCVLDEELFEPPEHYVTKNASTFPINTSDEDLFQWSTDESPEKIDIYQALNAPRTLIKHDISPDSDAEEQLLQRAIEESLLSARRWPDETREISGLPTDQVGMAVATGGIYRSESMEILQRVLELSREEIEQEAKLREDEEDALKRALELSLLDK
ncbi:unnamed protein product [Allacma fusca]|uniref:Ankyrin repeat domain-containing protein n=1 Tax=Allacma fusca TaxID=39272 RepID=A0A8J2JVE2_9HEXA|nr:unnamed protein product [Allacma fusca]